MNHTVCADSRSRDERITSLMPKVHRLAAHVYYKTGRRVDLEELIGAGYEAIVRAVDAYEPSRGSLEHYAGICAMSAMLHAVRSNDPVSERARATLREASAYAFDFATANGRMPTADELEAAIPGYRIAQLQLHTRIPLRLDHKYESDDQPFEIVGTEYTDESALLNVALDALTARERKVIVERYFCAENVFEIARKEGVSETRIYQIERSALRKMRRVLDAA